MNIPLIVQSSIWFVHGLFGSCPPLWTHSNGTFTPDLVRVAFPNARVFLWKNLGERELRQNGNNLAYAVANSRIDGTERPIIFVAHGLGGLVVQQALLLSLEPVDPRLNYVATDTAGIIYLGAPQMFSYIKRLRYTLARWFEFLRRPHGRVLSYIKQRAELFGGIIYSFGAQALSDAGQLNHVEQFYFWEGHSMDIGGRVVPKYASYEPGMGYCCRHASHMDMIKFSGLNDPGFMDLANVIYDWILRYTEQQQQPEEEVEDDPAPPYTSDGESDIIELCAPAVGIDEGH
ncbi:alpha/beta-Hydrolase [Penicillium capsulatum]|uniref:Alpha/beta-Hydrolase n=1 Tax=Penicillium capsulatum TaxID=69766 RepID=A0A9W9LYH1_9EURO|nr:alpha/beta-Hydrolase [Penicillium capsulatum]